MDGAAAAGGDPRAQPASAGGTFPSDRTGDEPAAAPEPEGQPEGQDVAWRLGDRLRSPDPLVARDLVPVGWAMTAPVMALVYLLTIATHMAVPGRQSAMLAGGAAVVAACAPLFARVERARRELALLRYLTMVVAVAGPMLGFGAAMALLLRQGMTANPVMIVGGLVIVGGVGAIALSRRLPSMVAAQTALWSGIAVLTGSLAAQLILILGALIGIGATFRQLGLDQAAQDEQFAIRRAQLRAEEMLSDFEQTGQGWFWETDRRLAVTYVSAPIGRLLGIDSARLIGRPFTDLFVLDGRDSVVGGRDGERTLNFHLNSRSSFQDLALRAACRGDERWWSVNGRPVYDSFNNFLGFRGSGSDLTEKRRSEQQATRLAHYDSLTSLANRFQMSKTLEKLVHAPHLEQRVCAVFLLDLDRFKQVNDTMGHPAGDALLKQVAARLQDCVGEAGRVGRLGGDEFQVILPGRHERRELAELADAIIARLSQPYEIEGARVVIGASVGIAISPDDGATSDAIIRNADLALYAAKDRGRGVHHFYDPDLHSDAEERRQLEEDLRDALAHGGLSLHYQPVVATDNQKIAGFEALLRWNHPRLGAMSPAKFIPIAEDTGLIAQIGEWALRTACLDLAQWPESVRVAVNVSPLQFANPALPAIVTHALAAAQVNPARLELEITESVFLNDDAGTEAMFAALKRIGVRLALDDFGTGYSSLGYLKKAPFDKIKIDQSFVRGATQAGSKNGAIIASIVSLASTLGMETTAEGVETLDELDLMRELGVSHVQGYIYSKPMDGPEAARCVEEDLGMVARGPRSVRPPRRTMFRKVALEHGGERYDVTIRNISEGGAMLEGLWNVPVGLELELDMGGGKAMRAVVRWSAHGRIGVQFASLGTLSIALPDADAAAAEASDDPAESPTGRRQSAR